GMVLILMAVGVAASVLWDMAADLVQARRRARPARRPAVPGRPVPAAAAPPPPSTPRPTVPPPTGAVRAQPSPPPAPEGASDRFTELERADAFGDLLE